MGTTDSALKQITVGLTEGPENITFVSQMNLPLLKSFQPEKQLPFQADHDGLKQPFRAEDCDRCFDGTRHIPRKNNHKRNPPVGDQPLIRVIPAFRLG